MNCPKCKADSEVYDSRRKNGGTRIWRRRKCQKCGHRWTTNERILRLPFWLGKPQPSHMKILAALAVPLLVFLTGCIGPVGYTRSLSKLHVGMTKQEVIRVMGEPNSVAAAEGVEYLNYHLAPAGPMSDLSLIHTYFVRIREGKVDAFGRRGDFDSTKDPTVNVKIQER